MTTTTIPLAVAALVGRTRPLGDVFAAVAAVAAVAGDKDVAAAAAFLGESAALSHGWAGESIAAEQIVRDVTVTGAEAWTSWRGAMEREDDRAASCHPNGWGIGILPPRAGQPLASTTSSGRTIWAALPGGAVLRVTTRRAPGDGMCHVVAVECGADTVAIVATTRRAPADESEALGAWPGEDIGEDGPAVVATRRCGVWAFRPAGLRAASACAEPRHVGGAVVAQTAVWAAAAWGAGREAARAAADQERVLAGLLGRPMPRRGAKVASA
jgi:hypothetical protein